MAVVETRGIKKHFDGTRAVDGVDLNIREGELLVILGPSGCGKTTLMRTIAGLERPTAGDVLIGGQVVTELPPRDRKIAMVFQSYALYPHMKVFDNIAFPLRAQKGLTKEEIRQRVERSAGVLGIQHLLARKPRQLSGGERQRVALCRAMVKEPRVLLLDEPLSNLDAKLRASARDELQRFQRRLGVTTIFVTHDQVEAMGLGDRIVVMEGGKVRQVGTPQEVYHDSADIFVATFLGSPGMNLIPRDRFVFGFRPEQFGPKAAGGHDEQLMTFSFRVNRVENLGADRLLYGIVEGAPEDQLTIARIATSVEVSLESGRSYDFVVQKQLLRFFDPATGRRIEPQPL